MKRIAAIFFILIAYIIFMAHAVIPHHHHESEVCFTESHCHTGDHHHDHNHDNHKHKHNPVNHDHQHHGNNDAEHCLINLEVVIPTNNNKFGNEYSIDLLNDFDPIYSGLSDFDLSVELQPSLPISLTPLIISYSSIASRSNGLRAPPIV